MTAEEKLIKIAQKLDEKRRKSDIIKGNFKGKEKVKALTTSERLDRIEQLLGIE